MDEEYEYLLFWLKRAALLALGGVLALASLSMVFRQYHEAWDTSVWSAGPEVLRH